MRHAIILGMAVSLTLIGGGNAQAGWREFWRSVHTDWHRNNAWPEPFQTVDRHAARAPWTVQENKGWQIETTLADYHFDHETQELTPAGELKVRWIVKDAPQRRRIVFVLRAEHDENTSIRVDSVQQAIARILPNGQLPEVVQTDVAPRGVPAEYVHDVNSQAAASRPAPVLPAATGSGSQ